MRPADARLGPALNRIPNPQSVPGARNPVWGAGGAGTVAVVGSGMSATYAQTWTTAASGGSMKTDIVYGGTYVIPVTPGEPVRFDVEVARTSGRLVRLVLAWDTSGGQYVSLVNGTAVAVSSDWNTPTTINVAELVPPTAGRARLSVDIADGSINAGDTLYHRRPRMNGMPYLDGSMPNARWLGVANRSQSVGYLPL